MNPFLSGTVAILQKELLIELRTKEIVVTAGLFGFLIVVLTSLAFFLDEETARRICPGVLWVSASFAGVLAMGRAWGREREADAVRGLLLSPIPRSSIFLGKMLGTLLFVLIIDILLWPIVAILFNQPIFEHGLPIMLILVLGTTGYVAMGTLFAAMSVRTRARDLMLSVVLFPLASPGLVAGVVATREILGGTPMDEIYAWFRILAAFDMVAIVSGLLLFEPLMSD